MQSLDAEVAGVRLVPYFQRYVSLAHPDATSGELLTKPEVSRQTEEFFTTLSVEEQFEVLEWQVRLQHVIHDQLGARVSINVHNRIVETEETRQRFLDVVGRTSAPTTFEFTETYPMPPVTAA